MGDTEEAITRDFIRLFKRIREFGDREGRRAVFSRYVAQASGELFKLAGGGTPAAAASEPSPGAAQTSIVQTSPYLERPLRSFEDVLRQRAGIVPSAS